VLILRWLAEQALRGRELLSFLVAVAISVWLASAPETVQRGCKLALTRSVFFPLQAGIDVFRFRVGLGKELDRARKENSRLVAENSRLSELVEIGGALKEFEAVRSHLEFPVVAGRVISRDPLRLGGTWILDIGSEAGVNEGMAVATASGLVGRVITSSPGHAQIQSLADPDCRVSVLSVRSRNPGILHSIDGSGVHVEFSVTSDIRSGDSLVTWGAGGIFPRGIPVGVVGEIRKTPANVLRNAKVRPFQDPWDVRDVFVLLRPPVLKVVPDSSVLQTGGHWK
jgi:rod shape-determining protein MreC